MSPKNDARRSIARNRRAHHEYHILEKLEAGLALRGTEVKSLRKNQVSLVGAYVRIEQDEAWLVGCQIPEYAFGNIMNHDPLRKRKLLLHASQIRMLSQRIKQDRLTVVPLELYFLGPRVKVEIALVKGKQQADKRQAMARRDAHRDMDRALRRRR